MKGERLGKFDAGVDSERMRSKGAIIYADSRHFFFVAGWTASVIGQFVSIHPHALYRLVT